MKHKEIDPMKRKSEELSISVTLIIIYVIVMYEIYVEIRESD